MAEIQVLIKKGDGIIPNQAQTQENLNTTSPQSKSQVNTLLIDYGKKLMQEGINTYINISGNSLMGNRINETLGIAADILTIAKGGVVGAIAVGFKTATQAVSLLIENEKVNNNAEFLKSSMGKVRTNGGRYV